MISNTSNLRRTNIRRQSSLRIEKNMKEQNQLNPRRNYKELSWIQGSLTKQVELSRMSILEGRKSLVDKMDFVNNVRKLSINAKEKLRIE